MAQSQQERKSLMSDPQANDRIRDETTKVKGRTYARFIVDLGKIEGRRKRRSFKSLEAARGFLDGHEERQKLIGRKAGKLDDKALSDAVQAIDILKGRTSLSNTATFFMKHSGGRSHQLNVSEAIQKYLEDSEKQGLRETSLQDLRLRLGRFEKAFGSSLLTDVTRYDVASWLADLTARSGTRLSALSRRHYKVVCGGLFNYAVDREYLEDNPFQKKSRSRRKAEGEADEEMPEIISAKDVTKVMRAAEAYQCDTGAEGVDSMVPAFAVGFFAGIRTAELKRLAWENADLAGERITVPPTVAKKRSVRYVDIEPNLLEWLTPYRRKRGPLTPRGGAWRYHFDAVRNEAGLLRWPHNCMRHCFATFHLAKYRDRRRTELQLGHRSDDLLYAHYRALATKQEAEEYFNIMPRGRRGKK